MNTTNTSTKRTKIAGWILSGLIIAFLLFDSFGKFAQPEPVISATLKLGYPVSVLTALATVLLISTILYAIPRTAVWGAILLTGYLGGAVATHVRVQDPLFSHTLFPVYFGILIWAGLALRDSRIKAMFG